ncbi:MAG: non-canonical purine NTP pyrophosphatase, partial [Cyanobium sp. MAG_137]|nr:non-canonical purine NTP pyrophosphatase [Cyanobium sp. MAG_137]
MDTKDVVCSPVTKLVIASGNAGKVREFQHLLAGLKLTIEPQPDGLEVEETGSTFAENARLKAVAVASATGCWALADDSGLSVHALGGAPGVHSARYASSDAARITRLLQELEGASDRSAEFSAALAVADPSGRVRLEVEGRCAGLILATPQGSGGFGY